MDYKSIQEENIHLKKEVHILHKTIAEQNKIITMFETAFDLSRDELLDAKKLIESLENLQDLSRDELSMAEKIIKAQEEVSEIKRQELMNAHLTIEKYKALLKSYILNKNK